MKRRGYSGIAAKAIAFGLVLPAACSGTVEGPGGEDEDGNDAPVGDDETDDGGGGSGGSGGSMTPPTACRRPQVSPSRWRRLTASQYQATVKDLLGISFDTKSFLQDGKTGPFGTNADNGAQPLEVRKYHDAAETIAGMARQNLRAFFECDNKVEGDDACAARFVDTMGARAWRRPLGADERKALLAVFAIGKEQSYEDGIRLTLEAMLQSPSFLYVVESGEPTRQKDGSRRLTGYEIAARLSYLLWGTMPDAELTKAAQDNRLATRDGVQAAARRLIESDRFVFAAQSFHRQLVDADVIARGGIVTKEAGRYPQWNDALKAAMLREIDQFVAHAFSKDDGSLETLYTAPLGFPTMGLETVYGSTVKPGADGSFRFADGSRAGLLTLPATLAAHPAVPTEYAAVTRGKLVRESFFCEEIAAPPPGVVAKPPSDASKLSQQELLRRHQTDPACKSCHELMDSLGFAFEPYDALGVRRARAEDGSAFDASGTIVGTDVEGPYEDAADLTRKLLASEQSRSCMATQWFRFALGRDPGAEDACSLQTVEEILIEGRGDVREALLAFVATDAFLLAEGSAP